VFSVQAYWSEKSLFYHIMTHFILDRCTTDACVPHITSLLSLQMELQNKGIKHSSIGGHHHNGVAKNAIKNTVRTGRMIMIYRCNLWPLALSHVIYLHNKIPSQASCLTPHELWSCSKLSLKAPLSMLTPGGALFMCYNLGSRMEERYQGTKTGALVLPRTVHGCLSLAH
jgi:hypothetical protein